LQGIAEVFDEKDKLIEIATAIDKLEKAGIDKVVEELESKGLNAGLVSYFKDVAGKDGFTLDEIKQLFENKTLVGLKGVEEIEFVTSKIDKYGLKKAEIEIDFTLARGLNYYTGTIIEVKAKDVSIGSITGGGRYDNLTGVFGLNDVSGVGISFGADRIYDVLEQTGKFPASVKSGTKILFVNFGDKEADFCNQIIFNLREKGIAAELYPDKAKMKKQMNYADKKQIPFVILIGENEINENKLTIKNMNTGHQDTIDIDDLYVYITKWNY
jgi:histidyl-tRNA synthetase